ncbi:MAG: DUF357 domain-containing protein [Methanocorpusculum sp.]|nr:DUF357 domain-containing protein [Methanocorpusculum sp.]
MLTEDFLNCFSSDSVLVNSAVPKSTILNGVADEILEMVNSYASDAVVFLKKGDCVNAFAAAAYGYGWLDCGIYLGFLTGRETAPIPTLENTVSEELIEHLTEKTNRYQRMLNDAVNCVEISPDSGSVMYTAAEKIMRTAKSHLSAGGLIMRADMVNALSIFSYGYGWLDCGVRAGLFQIKGDRHLFTI